MTTEAKIETKKTISEELRIEAGKLNRFMDFAYGGFDRNCDNNLHRERYALSAEKFEELLSFISAAAGTWYYYIENHKVKLPIDEQDNPGYWLKAADGLLHAVRDIQNAEMITEV